MRESARQRSNTIASVIAFACTLALWSWIAGEPLSPVLNSVCIVGTVLLVFPTVWVGRKVLDDNPTMQRVAWVTAAVQAIAMLLLGVAIIKAIQTGASWQGVVIPIPRSISIVLMYVTGSFLALTVVNLALRGMGAPFAVALSRRLATDLLYSRTRNPMVLAFLVSLVAVGLWLQSALFLIWASVLIAPALLFYVKVYEERELEIRFGEAYREYRSRTSFLWPGKPGKQS